MNRKRLRSFIALVIALPLASFRQPSEAMFPAFVLFRGPGLAEPVLLHHANVVGNNMSRDPLAIVYGSLQAISVPGAPASLASRPDFEVAEFFGAEWTGAIHLPDGIPTRPLRFEEASHFSRLYAASGTSPAVWENPVVAPLGSQFPYFSLEERGQRILDSLGVRLRPS